jgi:hypothetical protein
MNKGSPMHSPPIAEVPKWVLQTLNNLYDIERKLHMHGDPGNAQRNVARIKDAFGSENIFYEDPMGQKFNETRTDLEASIAGSRVEDLVVIEVIKPIVRFGEQAFSRVIQRGIVIVKSSVEGSN